MSAIDVADGERQTLAKLDALDSESDLAGVGAPLDQRVSVVDARGGQLLARAVDGHIELLAVELRHRAQLVDVDPAALAGAELGVRRSRAIQSSSARSGSGRPTRKPCRTLDVSRMPPGSSIPVSSKAKGGSVS